MEGHDMKTWIKPVGAVLIAGTLLVGGTFLSGSINSNHPVYADNELQKNIISVVGSGEISAKPDVAYLSLGVETQADTAKEAQAANAAKIAKINTLLKDTWKIDAKDIQTGQFYVQPNYTYTEKEGQKVKGYTAQHTLNVTYRDLAKVGQLLDGVSQAGANRIDNIRFSTENPDQYQEQVIEKAMNNAKMKAGAIAKSAGRSLGVVVSVTQSGGGETPVYMQNEALQMKTMDSAASTAIEPGEVTLKTTLSVIFEMK